jgi:hypothetical protein
VVHLTSTALAEDEVVGTEECTKRPSSNRIHGTGFEIDKDGTWDIFVSGCLRQELVYYGLMSSWLVKYLVEVDVHTFELEVGCAIVADICQSYAQLHSSDVRTLPNHQGHVLRRSVACDRVRWEDFVASQDCAPKGSTNLVALRIISKCQNKKSEGTYTLAGLQVNLYR